MNKHRKLLAALLALMMVVSITACGKGAEPAPSEDASSGPGFENSLDEEEIPIVAHPSHVDEVKEKKAENSDTVGWLHVPGTTMNDVVVHYPDDPNEFYWHRNFKKEQISIANFPNYENNNSWAYFADFLNKFGTGKAEDLSTNTVIYGHTYDIAVDENSKQVLANGTEETFGKRFAPLKYFYLSEDFAKKTPYIYFSTEQEDLVWEVFAVFFVDINLPYNVPNLPDEEYAKVLDECLKRSVYTYDVDVAPTDKILTLSTCTYYIPGNTTYLGYPNNYRYVVMAKLVDGAQATKTEAAFERNPEPKAP